MATTQKKSSSRSGSKSGGGKNSKAAAGSKAKSSGSRAEKAPAKKPVRREVGGLICLLFALLIAVSYFTNDGLVMQLFPTLFRGLLGFGYYLMAPALVAAAWILLTHRGKPVVLRTVCALLTPWLFGMLCHILFCKLVLDGADGLLKTLWTSGGELYSGGVLSGLAAHWADGLLGRAASIIIVSVGLFAALMAVFQVSLSSLVEMWRDREHLDYNEEDYEEQPVVPVAKPRETPKKKEAVRQMIDIPLDDEVPPAKVQKEETGGFFRPRSKGQMTPADVIAPQQPAAAEERPAVPEKVSAMPVPEPIPVEPPVFVEPAPIPEEAPAEEPAPPAAVKKSSRKTVSAEEMEQAAAEVTAEIESTLAAEENTYTFPPVTLLEQNGGGDFIEAGAELRTNAQRLADTLRSFGVDAVAGDVVRGPAITRYEFMLEQGVKLSKVTNLADDIALALGASGVRIAPIPDKISVVGIEVPNRAVTSVLIRDVIESRAFTEHKSAVAFAVGRDISNRDIVGDISKLPHVLIAGTTGSGKSVCTNSLIVSLLYKSSPEDVRFIMVDPKMVELAPYNGIPHLLIPVVTDPKKAAGALQWAVYEMMKRYKLFSEHNVKKLEEYNALAAKREDLQHLPSVVVVIDELADLMLVAAKEVEESICRVAQMGRAAGMHLVIATQRPSSDVITGLMKANIPSRIAFAVASSLESRIILDNTGAEKLVGRGDMLYGPLGGGKPQRVQGCFISAGEIERVVDFVKSNGEAQYSDEVMKKIEESLQEKEKKGGGGSGGGEAPVGGGEDGDELLPAAVEVVLETGQASVSMLQRRLKLGYSRAARLVDQMEERGIVGPFEGSKPRQLLITREKWAELQMSSNPQNMTADEAAGFKTMNWDDGEHVIPWEDQ